MTEKKKSQRGGLGRGLSALMAEAQADPSAADASASARADRRVPIDQIKPNPDQPRKAFAEDALAELASSIAEKGVIQPLIVREAPTGSGFEIVAGERRWRAAQRARLHDLPVIVRDFSDTEVLEIAIIENIQRSDLNPIEEARAYRQLMERHGHTQEKLAEALGKSRSHIANLMRLLNLPPAVLAMVESGALSSGHARAILTADDPEALAKQIVSGGLSVRDAERLVKMGTPSATKTIPASPSAKDADTLALERELSAALGVRATIDHQPDGRGKLTLSYKTADHLDDLCRLLTKSEI